MREHIFIYNIAALTVHIELMWWGLETGERRALMSLSIRFMPSHINSILSLIPVCSVVAEKIFECVSPEGPMSISVPPVGHVGLDLDLPGAIGKGTTQGPL
jgi:hypothetical protein